MPDLSDPIEPDSKLFNNYDDPTDREHAKSQRHLVVTL
jgi:hypothetical protein